MGQATGEREVVRLFRADFRELGEMRSQWASSVVGTNGPVPEIAGVASEASAIIAINASSAERNLKTAILAPRWMSP